MNFIYKISPAALKQFDSYLRVNHTWIWSTAIHLHLYLGILLTAVFSIVGLLYSVSLTDVPSPREQETFFGILIVPAIVLGLLILYNMSLFNTDKSHAYRFRYQEFFLLLIYFISFCIPLVIPYSASTILNKRVATLITDQEFEHDREALDKARLFFPEASGGYYNYYPTDSAYIHQLHLHSQDDRYAATATASYVMDYGEFWRVMRDSIFYHKGIFSEKRPHLYYETERLWAWNNGWETDPNPSTTTYRKDSAFRQYLKRMNIERNPSEAAFHIAQMRALTEKYFGAFSYDEQDVLSRFKNNYYLPSNENVWRAQGIETVEAHLYNIMMAKDQRVSSASVEMLYVFMILAFCITLLFQMYKNVHWNQLLLAIGLGTLILTLMVIIEVVAHTNGDFFLTMSAWLPVVFLIFSLRVLSLKRFSWKYNVVVLFLNALIPFFPVIFLLYMDEIFRFFTMPYFDKYMVYEWRNGYFDWFYTDRYYEVVNMIKIWTFVGGVLLYAFVWNSYLKVLYLRLWSLPKNK
jgi:hypothetical protein